MPVAPDRAARHAERVRLLAPLLASIAREIEERSAALEILLVRRGALAPRDSRSAVVEMEAAAHRRELRQARKELARLRCGIVSTRPCVFCVSVGDGPEIGLVYWEAASASRG